MILIQVNNQVDYQDNDLDNDQNNDNDFCWPKLLSSIQDFLGGRYSQTAF